MADFWQEVAERGCRSLVILAPHPDDEVFGLAGIMSVATQLGFELTVLAVTDGEASHAGSTVVSPNEIAKRRLHEISRAYSELGIDPERIRLGLPDGGVTPQALRELLPKYLSDACALLAPLADDGHPDHDACGQAAAAIVREKDLLFYAHPIWAYHRDRDKHRDQSMVREVCFSDEVLQAKRRAMACFVSQFQALGPAPEDGPVLRPGFEAPFSRSFEVLYS